MNLNQFTKETMNEFEKEWQRSFKHLLIAPDEAIWTGKVLKKFEQNFKKSLRNFVISVVTEAYKAGEVNAPLKTIKN